MLQEAPCAWPYPHGGRDEQEPQGNFRGVHEAANGGDGEPADAHGQEVQRARAAELVFREAARGQEQDYRGAGEARSRLESTPLVEPATRSPSACLRLAA